MDSNLPAAFVAELLALLGPGGLLLDPAERLAYAYDNSRRHSMPDAVALPTDAAQVQAIVLRCREHAVPITARGRGTNTVGASVPVDGGLVMSFERMNRIIEIRPGDRVAIVEPGVLNGDLQKALSAHQLFWPPDPTSAPYCTIGGNLGCNAGGPRAVKYGATRDNVLALTAVTGTGERVRFGAATTKASSGYDLSRLLVGSEGTLALVVEATLRLLPLPPQRRVMRAMYADTAAAAKAVARLMAQPMTPSMLEYMDARCVMLARDVGGVDLPDAGAMLLIEADGDANTLPTAIATLQAGANGEGCLEVRVAANDAEREVLWAARKALSPALRTIAPGKINEDVVVPVSRLPALVERVGTIAAARSLDIVCFGHAGNGNLHVNILYDPADTEASAQAEQALGEVFEATLALGGQLSGEHGIGMSKRDFMARALDPATLALMQSIKKLLDPDGIMNPGKLLPPPGDTTA